MLFFNLLVLCCTLLSQTISEKIPSAFFSLNDFKETSTIKGEARSLAKVGWPVRLTIIPEKGIFLCIDALAGAQKLLVIYDITSCKHITSLISRGAGNNEMLGPFQMQYNSRNGGELYILDNIKQQLFVYNVDSLMAGSEVPKRIIGQPGRNVPMSQTTAERLMRAVVIDNNYNIADLRTSGTNSSQHLINRYDKNLAVKDSFGFYPVLSKEVPTYTLGQVVDGCLSVSQDGKHLIFNSLTMDYLAIYSTSGKLIAHAVGPGGLNSSYKIDPLDSTAKLITFPKHNGYASRARAAGNTIYVEYNGLDKKKSGYHIDQLFEFDANLRPKHLYKFDSPVYDLEVDWKSKKIYTLRNLADGPELVVYKIR